MQTRIGETQCFLCRDKKECSQAKPYCNPCDGDSEECLTCDCLDANYRYKMFKMRDNYEA